MTAPGFMLDAGLPANVDAERTILGAIMNDNATFYDCADLQARHFSLDSHHQDASCQLGACRRDYFSIRHSLYRA